MKVLVKSARDSDDPTKAAFPFLHGNALAEAGHDVQIFLCGEAVSLMRDPVANAVIPVGWPALAETWQKTILLKYGSMSEARARGHVGSLTPIWLERMPPLLALPFWYSSSSGQINYSWSEMNSRAGL
jgi:hypothetical protein